MSATSPFPLDPVVPGESLPGTPYRIVRLLGAGGFGEVYQAVHTHLGAPRAVKVLAASQQSDPLVVERMRLEARTLAQLHHPNLVEVLDMGTSGGRLFFAMELLEGQTLRSLMNAGPMTWENGVLIMSSVLDGLQAAHSRGLVHRDVKPENIFVCSDGAVKLLDFGIAKAADLDSLTQSGVALGTPRYMAPEQILAKPVDARTDVYAIGVVLHELLTGRPLFDAADVISVAYAHVHGAPPTLDPTLAPERIARTIERALSKNPSQRIESAAAFAAELRATLTIAMSGTVETVVARTLDGRTKRVGASGLETRTQPIGAMVEARPAQGRTRLWMAAGVVAASVGSFALGYAARPAPPAMATRAGDAMPANGAAALPAFSDASVAPVASARAPEPAPLVIASTIADGSSELPRASTSDRPDAGRARAAGRTKVAPTASGAPRPSASGRPLSESDPLILE